VLAVRVSLHTSTLPMNPTVSSDFSNCPGGGFFCGR
jgi:hypothetical protein